MKETAEQTYWIAERGVVITLPPSSTEAIVQSDGRLSEEESLRLAVIEGCTIMRKRYPNPQDGYDYMTSIDTQWRIEMYKKAAVLADQFAFEARNMGLGEVSILLFGSVAKNLVKPRDHKDPSNIDIVVIGNFDKTNKDGFLDNIRRYRDIVQQEIGNNVGVLLQSPEVLRKNNYGNALNFISSSARELRDPGGLWKRIESEALEAARGIKRYKRKTI